MSYSFNQWKYKGPHRGGPEEWADQDLSDRAKHRLNAGVRYSLFADTTLLADYKYQDKQVQQVMDIIDDDPSNIEVREITLEPYQVVDLAVEQTLLKAWQGIETVKLKVFASNVFNEEYSNSRGYPMTDRTFGAVINCRF